MGALTAVARPQKTDPGLASHRHPDAGTKLRPRASQPNIEAQARLSTRSSLEPAFRGIGQSKNSAIPTALVYGSSTGAPKRILLNIVRLDSLRREKHRDGMQWPRESTISLSRNRICMFSAVYPDLGIISLGVVLRPYTLNVPRVRLEFVVRRRRGDGRGPRGVRKLDP